MQHKDSIRLKYLVTGDRDLLWGVTMTTTGYHSIEPDFEVYPPVVGHPNKYHFSSERGRMLDEYQLIYITKGKGIFTDWQQEQTRIKEGDMILVRPSQWHSYMPDKKSGWDEHWIGFKGSYIDERFENGFFNPNQNIYHVGMREEILDLYKKAVHTATREPAGYQQVLAGIVNYLIGLTLSYDKTRQFESGIVLQMDKARLIIRDNIYENITPEQVASQLNMSYSWFRKTFKEFTGMSPSSYIHELRLQISKDLLTTTTMSIKDIAYTLNYDSAEYFSSQFKRNTGKTPLKYRFAFTK